MNAKIFRKECSRVGFCQKTISFDGLMINLVLKVNKLLDIKTADVNSAVFNFSGGLPSLIVCRQSEERKYARETNFCLKLSRTGYKGRVNESLCIIKRNSSRF